MKAVAKPFTPYATHYMLIGAGLNVNVSDLILIPGAASNNLIIVFERWLNADRDVNWDTLIELCDDYPDQLGKAKSSLQAYIGKFKSLILIILYNACSNLKKIMCMYTIPVFDNIHYNYLNTLGQSIPDNVSSHTVLPSPVDDISNAGIRK